MGFIHMAKIATSSLDSKYKTYTVFSEKEDYALNYQLFDEITYLQTTTLVLKRHKKNNCT